MNAITLNRTLVMVVGLVLQLSEFACRSHAAAGDVDLSFDPGSGVNGNVTCVLVQPDGKVLIAGAFTTVKGLARTNLARLNADGSGDATFDASPAMNTPTALALQSDGKLLVAGPLYRLSCDEFECYEDYPASVVRLNANGSRDVSFATATAEYSTQSRDFRALVPLPDGRILVGGHFYSINGTNRVGIARLNANGTLDPSFNTGAGPDRAVSSIALQPDGKMLIAGEFSMVDGTNRNSVARLNANGTLDSTFDAGFVLVQYPDCGPLYSCFESTNLTALALQPDGKVLVGVWSRQVQQSLEDGQTQIADQYSVKRLNAGGSSDASFVSSNAIALVGSILVQPDGKLLVRHGFGSSRIDRLNANGSLDHSFNSGTESGGVNAVALQANGRILIAGTFTTVHGTNRNRLARLNSDGTLDLALDSGQGLERAVSQLALGLDGKVLVGGPLAMGDPWWGPLSDELALVNGSNQHGRLRLNGNGRLDHGFVSLPFNPPLTAFYHLEDCLGDPRYGCYQGAVTTAHLVQTDGKVLISGYSVSTITGDETFAQYVHPFLGRFAANGGLESVFNLPDSYVTAMAQQPDGKIVIAGGLFLNGTNATVARLNPNGSLDASFPLGQEPASVVALALQPDGKVVVGGANTVARLNSNGSRDSSFGPVTISNGVATCLMLQSDGRALIAGSFTSVNGTNRQRIARLNSDGTLDNSFDPGAGPDGFLRSIALQPDGNILIGGNFTTVNGMVRPYVARLYGAEVRPSLSLTRSNGLAVLSWPLTTPNFQLQESTNLALVNSWSPVAQSPVTNGAQISVTVPASGERKFFRLKSP